MNFACITAAAALVMAALPTDAGATPGYEVHPGGIEIVLVMGKQRNYVISVSANNLQRVRLDVDNISSKTEYSTKGQVNSRHVVANFGTLGRVDVKLHLVRHASDPWHKGRCTGPGAHYQEGTYRGMIKFSHRGNVPKLSIERGRTYMMHRFKQVCKRQQPQSALGGKRQLRHKIEAGLLFVDGKSNGRTVHLDALDFALKRKPAHSGGSLAVEAYERLDGVRIATRKSTLIDYASFAMGRRGAIPETVEVELPAPFSGRAVYSHGPGSPPTWTGDLEVYLPGAGRIPLTGPDISASLCRGTSTTELENCAPRPQR